MKSLQEWLNEKLIINKNIVVKKKRDKYDIEIDKVVDEIRNNDASPEYDVYECMDKIKMFSKLILGDISISPNILSDIEKDLSNYNQLYITENNEGISECIMLMNNFGEQFEIVCRHSRPFFKITKCQMQTKKSLLYYIYGIDGEFIIFCTDPKPSILHEKLIINNELANSNKLNVDNIPEYIDKLVGAAGLMTDMYNVIDCINNYCRAHSIKINYTVELAIRHNSEELPIKRCIASAEHVENIIKTIEQNGDTFNNLYNAQYSGFQVLQCFVNEKSVGEFDAYAVWFHIDKDNSEDMIIYCSNK